MQCINERLSLLSAFEDQERRQKKKEVGAGEADHRGSTKKQKGELGRNRRYAHEESNIVNGLIKTLSPYPIAILPY